MEEVHPQNSPIGVHLQEAPIGAHPLNRNLVSEKPKKDVKKRYSRDVIDQAKLITSRNKFWTRDVEKLLRSWRRKILEKQKGHRLAEKEYSQKYYWLGIPTTILMTVTSSGILTTFQNCDQCGNLIPALAGVNTTLLPSFFSNCAADEWVRFSMGIVGVFGVILSAISLFMDYGSSRTSHKTAYDSYEELGRDIDDILSLKISARGDPTAVIQRIKSKFDSIDRNSPALHEKYESISLDYKTVFGKGSKMKFPTSFSSVSLHHKPKENKDLSTLAKILADKIEDENKKIDEKLKENDYETSDDDRDVILPFDPETIRPGEDITQQKKDIIEQSIKSALQFELGRFFSNFEPPVEDHRYRLVDQQGTIDVPIDSETANAHLTQNVENIGVSSSDEERKSLDEEWKKGSVILDIPMKDIPKKDKTEEDI